jgi:hypothetical protein
VAKRETHDNEAQHAKKTNMFFFLAILLTILWLLGLCLDVGGGLIHLLLVAALVAMVFDMVAGRRRGAAPQPEIRSPAQPAARLPIPPSSWAAK